MVKQFKSVLINWFFSLMEQPKKN